MFNVEQFNRIEYTFVNGSYSYGVDVNNKKYKSTFRKSSKITWYTISDYEYDLALAEATR